MTEAKGAGKKAELDRTLSLFALIMMGCGMMVGAGVFVASGLSIAQGGAGAVIIAFAVNGLIALFTAMSYAELSSAIPRAGGPYNWASYGYGRAAGFMTGWMEWLAAIVAGSLYAITFSAYTVKFSLELLAVDLSPFYRTLIVKAVALAVSLLFIYVNMRGASETGAAGVIMAAGQMLALLAIVVAAVARAFLAPERLANFNNFLPAGWGKVLVAMGLTYVAFEGFEVICQAGDEAIQPRRNLPKALFYSLFLVVTIYLAISFAITIGVTNGNPMAFFQQGGNASIRFSDAVKNLMPLGGIMVTIAVVFSATSALNATIYSATRISYALGRDRFLPGLFARISERTRIPSFALAATSVLLIVIAVFLPIEHIAAAASILFILVFMMGNLAVLKIRKDYKDNLRYGYIMPLFPLFPIVACLVQLVMVFTLFRESHWTGPIVAGWVVLGMGLYLFYANRRAIAQKIPLIVLEKRYMPLRKKYTVLVPLAHGHQVNALMDVALKVAESRDGEILALNFIRIPEQSPVTIVEKYLPNSRTTVAMAEAFARDNSSVPVHSAIKYGRDFKHCIMQTIQDYDVDMLILGWRGQTASSYHQMGSSIDPILENASCYSLVVNIKEYRKQPLRRIIVPTGRRFLGQTMLALDIARAVAVERRTVTLWTMKPADRSDKSVINQLRPLTEYARSIGLELSLELAEPAGDVAGAIVDASADYDLLIIGASKPKLFKKTAFGDIPERIGKQSRCPVIMVKSTRGVQSFINRWLGT